MAIRSIRLPQQDRDSLIRLKTKTGIGQWNILCRWALAVSLKEQTSLTALQLPGDSNVEMTWEVFGGEFSEIWLAALRERCQRDGLPTDDQTLMQQLRLHMHRGVGYLSAPGHIKNLADLSGLAQAKR